MERIKTEEFFKSVINEETGETTEVLDYTMRYTYDVTTVMVDIEQEDGTTIQEPKEVETLVKEERVMNDGIGTTILITRQAGCICIMQTYPVVVPKPRPKTQLEILQEAVDAIIISSLGV